MSTALLYAPHCASVHWHGSSDARRLWDGRARACTGRGDRVGIRRTRGRRTTAPRGDHGLRRPGAGRQRRRHLARQQLPRVRLRRALPPVFLLLRAQPGLAALLLRPEAHPRLPGARHGHLRAAPAPALQRRGEADDLGRRAAALGHRDHRRRLERGRRRLRHRAAVRAQAAGRARTRHLPRQGVPLRPLGPRLRPARQARRRDRHRRLRHPDRPVGPEAGGEAHPLPAHPRLGAAPHGPAHRRRRARRAPGAALHHQAAPRGAVGHPGAPGAGVHQAPGELGFVEQLAKRNMARAIKDPELRAKLTPTTASAASGSCCPARTTRPSRSPTWTSSRAG